MAKRKKKACPAGRFKSGKRKGRCKPKGSRKAARRSSGRGNFCVKIRGKSRAVRCYRNVQAALKAASKLNQRGVNAVVKGSGKMV